jgi:hypothetical protein
MVSLYCSSRFFNPKTIVPLNAKIDIYSARAFLLSLKFALLLHTITLYFPFYFIFFLPFLDIFFFITILLRFFAASTLCRYPIPLMFAHCTPLLFIIVTLYR